MRGAMALGCVLAFGACAAAQSSAWAAVQGVVAGSPVEVRLADGAKVKGKLVAASPTGMDLRTSHAIRYISQARVQSLFLTGTTHKLRDASIGFGAGVVGGAIFSGHGIQCYPDMYTDIYNGACTKVAKEVAGGVLIGVIAAGIGALAGLVKSHRVLVYRRGPGRNPGHLKTAQRRRPTAGATAPAASGSAGK